MCNQNKLSARLTHTQTGEELIYVVSGSGHVYVDGEIVAVREGRQLFSKDSVHMVRNSGDTEMKVACFFSEASNLTLYEFHPNVLLMRACIDEKQIHYTVFKSIPTTLSSSVKIYKDRSVFLRSLTGAFGLPMREEGLSTSCQMALSVL